MNIPLSIKNKRQKLKESQEAFGVRFGVSHAAVSDWESGKSEAPYSVIGFCLDYPIVQCPVCKGTGIIS